MDLSNCWGLKLTISAWLAQFRQPSAVTTQLSYILPSKTSLIGLLLAKAGYGRLYYNKMPEEYIHLNKAIKIAISYSKKSVVKYMEYVTLRNMNKKLERKPTKVEYVVLPKYEVIYLLPKDNDIVGEQNKEKLLNNEIFKTYLGSNESLVTIESSKEISLQKVGSQPTITTRFTVPVKFVKALPEEYINKIIPTKLLVSAPAEFEKKHCNVIVPIGEPIKVDLIKDVELLRMSSSNELIVGVL